MSTAYKVLRPPLVASFELPTQEDLLKLKVGDSAKLIFRVETDKPERMWVVITDCTSPDEWKAKIDNDAMQPATAKVLPADKQISFHPLDIVQTLD